MRVVVVCAFVACVLGAAAASLPGDDLIVRMEPDVSPQPAHWRRTSRADPNALVELSFAVTQREEGKRELERVLLDVSDPDSPNYGQHLSFEESNHIVAPRPESVRFVIEWLVDRLDIDESAVTLSPNGDFVRVVTTVASAEKLLSATYHTYAAVDASQIHPIVRCEQYHLPLRVARHVDFVAPTVRFPSIQRATLRSTTPEILHPDGSTEEYQHDDPDALFVTPSFLRSLYQVSNATGTQSSNTQSIASFLGQYWLASDLQTFFKLLQKSSVGHTVAKVIGPNSGFPGTEASLDIQYIMGVGENVTTWAYSTPGNAPTNPNNEPFLAWVMNMTSEAVVPSIVSVSYGDDEKSVGYNYASRINVEFQKLGVRGVSILFAAGDSGTGGNCTASKGRFNPNFPTGSPWVTSVGGMFGGTAGKTPTGEITDSISGGGFSDFWPRPSYQDAAVEAFLSNNTHLPDPSRWNKTGRGYPDIAAQSEGFIVVSGGLPLPGVGGTSCATPTSSGVFALLNDLRAQQGKSSLGFLNPLIYKVGASTPNAFNDAVQGCNMGCGSSGIGFCSRAGWDPATGFGSPNYAILSSVVTSLP